MDDITRVCRKCGQEKPLEEFAKNKECVLGRTHTCKQCEAEKYRKWREANLEKARESVRKWRESNRERGWCMPASITQLIPKRYGKGTASGAQLIPKRYGNGPANRGTGWPIILMTVI